MLWTDSLRLRLPLAPRLSALRQRLRVPLPLLVFGILLLLVALGLAPRPPERSTPPTTGQGMKQLYLGGAAIHEAPKAAAAGPAWASLPSAGDQEAQGALSPAVPAPSSPSPTDLGATITRQITRQANLTLQVPNLGLAYNHLLGLAARFGGYAQSAQWQRGNPGAEADLDLQIPAGRLESFLAATDRLGFVVSSQESGQDVTDQTIDTGARLRVLKAEEARYLSFLGQAKTVDQMVKVEDPLAQVQQEIEILTTGQRQLATEVAMAATHVTLLPSEARSLPAPTLGTAAARAWEDSIGTVKYLLERLYLALVWLVPFLPLGVIVYVAWRLSHRFLNR